MKHSVPLKLLVISLAACAAGSLTAGAEERPRLEDYPSSYEFLQAMQAWSRSHPGGESGTPRNSHPQTAIAGTSTSTSIDPTSELAPPPFEINGPENLEHAVEQAKAILHPAYKEKIRYHRTTHISFPLHSIESQDMSQASVGDALNLQGKTEKEKKAALDLLTSQLNQDQHRLQDKDSATEPVLAGAPTPPAMIEAPSQGPRTQLSITVAGH